LHLHHLGVARGIGADILVSRIRQLTAFVADGCIEDALYPAKRGLDAPETAHPECRLFHSNPPVPSVSYNESQCLPAERSCVIWRQPPRAPTSSLRASSCTTATSIPSMPSIRTP